MYADLLLRSGYIKIAEELVENKIYPYVVMHMLNDKNTKELIWHRDQYFHGKEFIGPKFKLYKLAIYLQDTNKDNGVTGFIQNSYLLDSIIDIRHYFCILIVFLSIHQDYLLGRL